MSDSNEGNTEPTAETHRKRWVVVWEAKVMCEVIDCKQSITTLVGIDYSGVFGVVQVEEGWQYRFMDPGMFGGYCHALCPDHRVDSSDE